ncbi:MAG: carbon-nitrogen hydrolase family protein, partial [Rhodospirillales bacterium]|nr:carbon-nitrogen hydrolase family protein [Rhodospirillales bacterium]
MTSPFTVACIQLTAARDYAPNIEAAEALIRDARSQGADLICLPENACLLEPNHEKLIEKAAPEETHPAVAMFRSVARETGAWLLGGSIAVPAGEGEDGKPRVFNRSLLIDSDGEIAGRYDKIHLFDVDLAGGESYRESTRVAPGGSAVIADTPWGRLGMTVCYDLRFPHLYRALARGGADFLSIPAAFTVPTGRAHWHTLLRARAIENGCFVFAPAQCGEHAEGRKTFGHSLIVDPWGEVLADGGESPGITLARIDPKQVEEVRHMVPSLSHD